MPCVCASPSSERMDGSEALSPPPESSVAMTAKPPEMQWLPVTLWPRTSLAAFSASVLNDGENLELKAESTGA